MARKKPPGDVPGIRGRKHEPGTPYSGSFKIRIAPALHERIAKLAPLQHRSLNSEVEYLLEEGLKTQKTQR